MFAFGMAFASAPGISYADHSWGLYHWARTTPQFTLKLGNNLTTTQWKSLLASASSDWNSPASFGAAFTPVLMAVTASHRIETVQ